MGNLPQARVLEDAANCFKSARRNLIEGAARLYHISTDSLWEGSYSSLGEFVEQECQISAGYASKLIKAYDYYIVKGGLSPRNLATTDPEKLYLAISLPGKPADQALKAETWTRQEIKAELAVKDGKEHEHEPITICRVCNKRM